MLSSQIIFLSLCWHVPRSRPSPTPAVFHIVCRPARLPPSAAVRLPGTHSSHLAASHLLGSAVRLQQLTDTCPTRLDCVVHSPSRDPQCYSYPFHTVCVLLPLKGHWVYMTRTLFLFLCILGCLRVWLCAMALRLLFPLVFRVTQLFPA